MKRTSRRGFTIVELIIVIAVIGILSLLVVVGYSSVQKQARDTQLRDAVSKVGDGLQLFYAKYGHFPAGGSGSSSALSGMECANGAGGGFIGKGIYTCTIEETLAANGYLPANFTSSLPKNKIYTPGANNYSIYIRTSGVTAGKVLVMYSMENALDEDTDHFKSEVSKCGLAWANVSTEVNTYGMKNGDCVSP